MWPGDGEIEVEIFLVVESAPAQTYMQRAISEFGGLG
jgi:hypothetical protein